MTHPGQEGVVARQSQSQVAVESLGKPSHRDALPGLWEGLYTDLLTLYSL
jgi:hypothetical protein